MRGFIFLTMAYCSLYKDYHTYYYQLLSKNIEFNAVLTGVSVGVLVLGSYSPVMSLVPFVSMLLKYSNFLLISKLPEVGWIVKLLGNKIENVLSVLQKLDEFVVIIPLISFIISYLLFELVDLLFFLSCLFVLYVLIDSLQLNINKDLFLVFVIAFTSLVIIFLLLIVLKRVKSFIVTFCCCVYHSLYFFTCTDIFNLTRLDMKTVFDNEGVSPVKLLVLLIGFSCVFFQYLLYPVLNTIENKKNIKETENQVRVEPMQDRMDILKLENSLLKLRLENLDNKNLQRVDQNP